MTAQPVTRADLLLALDGIVAACLTLRRLIEHAEEEPDTPDPNDWRGPCAARDGRAHDLVWAGAYSSGPDPTEQGVCAACGTEFERPAPASLLGVSGPETGGERP